MGERTRLRTPRNMAELLAVDLPFSIYFGWTTVASILNLTLAFVASGFDDPRNSGSPLLWFGVGAPEQWAVIMLGIAAAIFVTMVLKEGNWAYGFVYPWAVLAIRAELKSRQCSLSAGAEGRGVADPSECERLQIVCLAFSCVVGACSAVQLAIFLLKVGRVSSAHAAVDSMERRLDGKSTDAKSAGWPRD